MKNLIDIEVISAIVSEYSRPAERIKLYSVFGQAIFPLYASDGSLRHAVCLYMIRKGKTERAPINENFIMPASGEIVELADGWAVGNVTLHGDFSNEELRTALQAMEKTLLKKE